MAGKPSGRAIRRPRHRISQDEPGRAAYLYAGEVAKLADFAAIDYRQLRRLFTLVRKYSDAPDAPSHSWSRYSPHDIAALRIAVRLCRNPKDVDSRYLLIAPLEAACAALADQGIVNPLLDVPLSREGRTIYAEIDAARLDPTNGQQQLRDTQDAVLAYLETADLSVAAAERAANRNAVASASSNAEQHDALRGRRIAVVGS